MNIVFGHLNDKNKLHTDSLLIAQKSFRRLKLLVSKVETIGFTPKKGIVAFNFLKLKELKGVLKEAGNDKVAEVQLRIALLCIISNISLTQR